MVFCPGGIVDGRDERVPSFDGVPLDADLTLPSTGRPPYPLIVLLHGLGGNKFETESTVADGGLDNVSLASQGWAVLSYSARGFAGSCGTATSRVDTPACMRGWLHLADQRYEVRDTQYLAGMLVDEGYARPGIAVSGVSYGGAQALELAMLKNRTELENGRLVPFVSPRRHVPMRVAAVYAVWPWDDYVSALMPNGRPLVQRHQALADRSPPGVVKQAWSSILDRAEVDLGYLPPPKNASTSALVAWRRAALTDKPSSPAFVRALGRLQRFNSAIGVPAPKGGPAPTAIQSGFTDSLFPVSEARRFAEAAKVEGSNSPLLLIFDDVGHPWAQNKVADVAFNDATGIDFLNAVVRQHRRPRTGVAVRAQTCPASAPSGPTQWARSFSTLIHGSVTLSAPGAQVVTSKGGSQVVAAALNATTEPLCDPLPAKPEPGTARYAVSAGANGLHVLGGVRVTATLAIKGVEPELVGRLWDVAPDGTRQIVELGAFRPSTNRPEPTTRSATVTESVHFELPANDYDVPPGHRLELELVGSTAPFFRPSTGSFSIRVSKLRATVPLAAPRGGPPRR